jgi:hypothetical protein
MEHTKKLAIGGGLGFLTISILSLAVIPASAAGAYYVQPSCISVDATGAMTLDTSPTDVSFDFCGVTIHITCYGTHIVIPPPLSYGEHITYIITNIQ